MLVQHMDLYVAQASEVLTELTVQCTCSVPTAWVSRG